MSEEEHRAPSLEQAAEKLLRARRRAVLLVEDTAAHAALIRRALDPAQWEVEHVTRASAALQSFSADPDRIVLLDLTLPDLDGLTVLQQLVRTAPGAAVIVVTAREEVPVTVSAMQEGAWDYVVKGDDLGPRIRDSVERAWTKRMKEAEGSLIEQTKLIQMMRQERLQAIELIVRTVCHEVNNPLSGVVALSQLLSRNDALSDELKRLADGINRSAQDVARVVQKLHTIGDMEKEFGGKRLFDIEPLAEPITEPLAPEEKQYSGEEEKGSSSPPVALHRETLP